MKKLLLTLFTLATLSLTGFAQVVYEDFEGGTADLTWQGLDGTYDGVVDNPELTSTVNSSLKCGSYTKSNTHAYSLFLAEVATPLDLSVNNQFHLQVYATAPTQILLKLEGTTGSIEKTKIIANTGTWQDYTFDFSGAAANTGLTKIIIFFDPGVETSGDTYLFDNLWASPAGPCAGTVVNPLIIDDFECQRNAAYGQGWNILTQVANPDPTGINTSLAVGRYEDPLDEWSALVIQYHDALDLSVNNQVKAKVWCPKLGKILFKLEGGVSPPLEKWVDVTEVNKWVEYTADFSSQAVSNHKRIVIFFNGGVLATAGDVYYIDDIVVAPQPAAAALEDFEPQKMSWGPSNGDAALHGTISVISNPNTTGINSSAHVGEYKKGTSAYSTLTAFLPLGFSLSSLPQLNLHVLPPAGAVAMTMQLSSPSQGIKEVTRNFSGTGDWQLMSFDFSNYNTITDFETVNLIFDGGTAAANTTYLFDNLALAASSVDPCEGILPIPYKLDDFECQRNVTYGAGGDILSVVNNPLLTPLNGSLKAGKYVDPLDEWSALVLDFGQDIDLSLYNQFYIKINSPKLVPLKFKLEGGTSAPVELDQTVTVVNDWVQYVVDFSPYAGGSYHRVAIFFNAGQTAVAGDVYHVDDLEWKRINWTGCIVDHESPNTTLSNFKYFANGHLEAEGYPFKVVDNPHSDAVNHSDKVGEIVKAGNGDPWSGMYADLGAPLFFGTNKTAKMKVWMDHIGPFAMKLEGSTTGAPNLELPVTNTIANGWEELTYDCSAVTDDANYSRLTLFADFLVPATGVDVTSYFDDIVIGDGTCVPVSVFNVDAQQLQVYPNPVTDQLQIENPGQITRFEVTNLLGQRMISLQVAGNPGTLQLDVNNLNAGVYFLNGYTKEGVYSVNKFVKE